MSNAQTHELNEFLQSASASPQIDILVLRPEYPPGLLDKKLYLTGGVLAAFECKYTSSSYALCSAKFDENNAFLPIGEMMRSLLYKIAWEVPGLRRMVVFLFSK